MLSETAERELRDEYEYARRKSREHYQLGEEYGVRARMLRDRIHENEAEKLLEKQKAVRG